MSTEVSEVHKFDRQSGLTWREVFDFSFKEHLIPRLQALVGDTDRGEFLGLLEGTGYTLGEEDGRTTAGSLPSNDFADFKACVRAGFATPSYTHCLVSQFVEDNDCALGVKVTECLWEATFRDANALDLGYSTICHADFGFPVGFNPKIRLVRPKCLMQGDDCCDFRWELED